MTSDQPYAIQPYRLRYQHATTSGVYASRCHFREDGRICKLNLMFGDPDMPAIPIQIWKLIATPDEQERLYQEHVRRCTA